MKEELLHHIWKYQRFNSTELQTTTRQNLSVLRSGVVNTDSGPDFFNARVQIDGTIWAGNVELHIRSSDWYKHQHQDDPAYQNITLHVVWEDDIDFFNKEGIPTLELKNRIPGIVLERYQSLQNIRTIPCQDLVSEVDDFYIHQWLDRLSVERLERKSKEIKEELNRVGGNWEEILYRRLARNFGFKVNQSPFEQLSASIPLNILKKHHNSIIQLEALLFGVAGLLHNATDEYANHLQGEFEFLLRKYHLAVNHNCKWKFSRMRPRNFPTVRIAQFASLLHQSAEIFNQFFSNHDLEVLKNQFMKIQVSKYWVEHYRFGRSSQPVVKNFGEKSFENVVINTLAPISFAFGQMNGMDSFKERAIQWLEQTAAEKNAIIKRWEELNIKSINSSQSQGLIELYNEYCSQKYCLNCAIGNQILKPS